MNEFDRNRTVGIRPYGRTADHQVIPVIPLPGSSWTWREQGIVWVDREAITHFVPWTAIAELFQHPEETS